MKCWDIPCACAACNIDIARVADPPRRASSGGVALGETLRVGGVTVEALSSRSFALDSALVLDLVSCVVLLLRHAVCRTKRQQQRQLRIRSRQR